MFPSITFEEDKILRLLDVLESHDKFTPTHWGNSDLIKVAYSRSEIIKELKESRISQMCLYRKQSIKYSADLDIYFNLRSYLSFEFNNSMPSEYWEYFFNLTDQIATIAQPRYGVSHIIWPSSTPWKNERDRLHLWMDYAASPLPIDFIPNGPLGLGLRTYFSGEVLEMFGRDLLLSTPAIVKELEWGGIRIDLVERPWEADIDTILDQWLKSMKHLETANVIAIPDFNENGRSVNFSPNIEWEKWLKRD